MHTVPAGKDFSRKYPFALLGFERRRRTDRCSMETNDSRPDEARAEHERLSGFVPWRKGEEFPPPL
jgi:hypothetical protein